MITDEVEELELLKELRVAVEDLNQDELTLKRFLRARNHDLDKAEDMLRKCMEWRRLNKVDLALSWSPLPEVVDAFPVEYSGADRKGQVVMCCPVGIWRMREAFGKVPKDQISQYLYIHLEKLTKSIESTGKELFTLIVDYEGFSFWNFSRYDIIQHVLKIIRDFEANYPERLFEALVIYSPLAMHYGWTLVKPLLTGRTLDKVTFLGGDPRQFLPELLERIPPSSLPKKLYRLMNDLNLN